MAPFYVLPFLLQLLSLKGSNKRALYGLLQGRAHLLGCQPPDLVDNRASSPAHGSSLLSRRDSPCLTGGAAAVRGHGASTGAQDRPAHRPGGPLGIPTAARWSNAPEPDRPTG